MTISEHLERIKKVMTLQGANEMEVLYFQLYLLCLGYDNHLSYDDKHRRETEPYAMLEKHFNYLWGKASEHFEHEGKGCLEEFLNDENIIQTADRAVFLVKFYELLTREARHFDHTQPEEIAELVYLLSDFHNGMAVYNPYAGFGSYAGAFQAGNDYYGEEINLLAWGIGVLKMHMDGCSSTNYINGDSLNPTWGRRFDVVVSTPPYFPFFSESAIPSRRIEGYERLLNALPDLLEEMGSCIIVNNASILNVKGARKLLESSMLDMVMVLPDNLMYHTGSVQVIIRLKKNRDPKAPILMVDAKDFYSPGGRRRKILDVKRIMHVIQTKDSKHAAWVQIEEIRKNECILFPDVYLAKENTIEGLSYTPVNALGTVIRPQLTKLVNDSRLPFVSIKDLSRSPTHIVSPVITEFRSQVSCYVLTSPALLLARNSDSLIFGHLKECSPKNPVYISSSIMAFAPNDEIVSGEYVAAALSEATLSNMGSTAFRLTFTDFAITKIPVIPKREQARYVKRILKKNSPRRENSMESTRKIPIVVVGITELKDKTARISILRHFERVSDAKDWLISHPTTVEAVLVQIGPMVTESNVATLCERIDNIPVFILSPDLEKLEAVFKENYVEYNLGERAFSLDMLDELVETLAEVADLSMTPEGVIRRRYHKQLEDAESLDNIFRYENVILRDELEDLLVKLSKNDSSDMQNRMRKMRDNCFLQPLIDYGYLPNLRWDGANIDLLADRYYKSGDENFPLRIILNREILPESVAELLRTMSKVVLNPGSHDYGAEDCNTIMACLCVLMAALGVLADMVDSGHFKEKNSPKGFYSNASQAGFKRGVYEVKRLGEIKGYDYFHAGNVHLDNKTCQEIGIRVGDIVRIDNINGFEKEPQIDDYAQVYYYSKSFEKVKPKF